LGFAAGAIRFAVFGLSVRRSAIQSPKSISAAQRRPGEMVRPSFDHRCASGEIWLARPPHGTMADIARGAASMLDPDRFNPAAHVAAAAPAVGLVLDAERQARVAAAFALVVRIATPALSVPLDETDEPAPVFRP